MARRTTLVNLLTQFRAECKMSLNPAHHVQARDHQINLLRRTQVWLWEDFDWPFLEVDRFIDLQAGQRYYDVPSDLHLDRIERLEVRHDQVWCELRNGIQARHYAAYDSDLDARNDPAQRWRVVEDEQIEIWPIPASNADPVSLEGRVKVTGIRNLQDLFEEQHRADLDDRLIVLFAAAEYLEGKGAQDAKVKAAAAQRRYARLKGAQKKKAVTRLFVDGDGRRRERVPIAVYNSTS